MKKYVRFRENRAVRFGEVDGETVRILNGDIFAGTLSPAGDTVALSSIREFLPPVDPAGIFAIGRNYADHCKECADDLPPHPIVFIKAPNALCGHLHPVVLPEDYPAEVDYEAELAVVIGREASYVSEAEALDYVLGYCCANDVSARDVQLRVDLQWARGKSFDTFCPLGPWLVTGIEDPSKLEVQMYLNGELVQNQPVSDMIFSVAKIVSFLSRGITLRPGTVILTGTPSGVGMGRKPPRFLRPGDVAEVAITHLGRLRNTVV